MNRSTKVIVNKDREKSYEMKLKFKVAINQFEIVTGEIYLVFVSGHIIIVP